MCRKLSVRCRKWRWLENPFPSSCSANDNLLEPRDAPNVVHIQQQQLRDFFFSNSLLLLFMVRSQFPISLSTPTFVASPAIFRGSSKKLFLRNLLSSFQISPRYIFLNENLGCPNKQFLFSNLPSFSFGQSK